MVLIVQFDMISTQCKLEAMHACHTQYLACLHVLCEFLILFLEMLCKFNIFTIYDVKMIYSVIYFTKCSRFSSLSIN